MKDRKYNNIKVAVILMSFFSILFFGCHKTDSDFNKTEIHKVYIEKKSDKNIDYAVEAPPLTDDFPCNACHDYREPSSVRRELVEWHDEILFDHDSENRWCLDCHDMNSRDSLKLASGKLLDFKESYKLCGQCHGEKLRDWKIGVHGKRTGDWNGEKKYYLCVHCHNPHSPKFKPIKPEPPPIRQEEIN